MDLGEDLANPLVGSDADLHGDLLVERFSNQCMGTRVQMVEIHQEERPPTSGTMYYRTYQTRNGAIAVGCLSDPLRRRLLDALNLRDIRFEANYDPQSPKALACNAELIREAEGLFEEQTTGEWLELLGNRGIPAGPVRFVEELFDEAGAHRTGADD